MMGFKNMSNGIFLDLQKSQENLNLLITFLMIVLSFLLPQAIYGTEEISNNNTQKNHFQMLPQEMTQKVLTHASRLNILDLGSAVSLKSFYSAYATWQLVCKDWKNIIGAEDNKKEFFINSIISAYKLLGYEDACERFLNGKLIYRSRGESKVGIITLRIFDLEKPLGGTFDLSQCGDVDKYLSISTGYRKGKQAENEDKLEIWFAPRFLVEKELATTAAHFQDIYDNWNDCATVGIVWTWGGWDHLGWYDYLTSENTDNLSKINLYENWQKRLVSKERNATERPTRQTSRASVKGARISCSFCELK